MKKKKNKSKVNLKSNKFDKNSKKSLHKKSTKIMSVKEKKVIKKKKKKRFEENKDEEISIKIFKNKKKVVKTEPVSRNSNFPSDIFSPNSSIKNSHGFNVYDNNSQFNHDSIRGSFPFDTDPNLLRIQRNNAWKNKTVELPSRVISSSNNYFHHSLTNEKIFQDQLYRNRKRGDSINKNMNSLPIKRYVVKGIPFLSNNSKII
jgi:hypothetical protein